MGIIVKDNLLSWYSISIIDSQFEGIIWLQFIHLDASIAQDFCICVCYLPPSNSCRGDNASEFFAHLNSTIYSFQNIGPFCICGDLNARCGTLSDICVESHISNRHSIDNSAPNSHGKCLIDFLKATGLCMLNGRSPKGNEYTSISSKGLAMVDYCFVPIMYCQIYYH